MFLWDSAQYLQDLDLRHRPVHDLIAQVPLAAPAFISDLGCGPGNSTEWLAERWPEARLVGVDGSPEMLGAARSAHPHWHWQQADLADWSPPCEQDLLFSSSALHWLPNHQALFPRLLGYVRPGGVLAVQMPANLHAHAGAIAHDLIRELREEQPWKSLLGPGPHGRPLQMEDYHRILTPHASEINLWKTTYLLVLNDVDEILNLLKGAALRPLTRHLSPSMYDLFTARLRQRLLQAFPTQPSGKVLWPYHRSFVVAVRRT